MNRDDSKRPADDAASHDSSQSLKRSGEGAATALQAMLRKRQQAERPDTPAADLPPCPLP